MEDRKQIRATAIGLDQIVNVWETMNDGYPYFAVYYNRNNKYFQYNRDDIVKAKTFLENNLEALQEAGDNSLYYLNIYSESKPNYPNSGMICSFPFRLNSFESATVSGPGTQSFGEFGRMLEAANAKNLELAREIIELKAENQPLDMFDKISGLLEHPAAAQIVVPLLQPLIASIMGIIGKISGLPVAQMPVNNVPAISGTGPIDQNDQLDEVLDRLEKHGDLLDMLTTLANFADKNPAQFKVYFQALKSA